MGLGTDNESIICVSNLQKEAGVKIFYTSVRPLVIFLHKHQSSRRFCISFWTVRSTQGRGFPQGEKGNRCALEILWLSAKHPTAKKPLSNYPVHTPYLPTSETIVFSLLIFPPAALIPPLYLSYFLPRVSSTSFYYIYGSKVRSAKLFLSPRVFEYCIHWRRNCTYCEKLSFFRSA